MRCSRHAKPALGLQPTDLSLPNRVCKVGLLAGAHNPDRAIATTSRPERVMSQVEARIAALGLTLPNPCRTGCQLRPLCHGLAIFSFISGQICFGIDGKLADRHKGKLGARGTGRGAIEAARLCGLNVLAQARAALGNLDRITRCVRLGGFITPSRPMPACQPS